MLLDLIEFNLSRISAVFFDFDGVLVDSVPVKTQAYREIFRSYGEDAVRSITVYHQLHGGVDRYRKIRHVLNGLGIENEDMVQEKADQFAVLVKEKVIELPVPAGMTAILERLRESDVPAFIISGTPEAELTDIVKAKGIKELFREIRGSPETKTEILFKLIRKYSVAADRAVFIGDAQTDFDAAASAGCLFIGIPANNTVEERPH